MENYSEWANETRFYLLVLALIATAFYIFVPIWCGIKWSFSGLLQIWLICLIPYLIITFL